jgi:hypothetical protein
LNAERIRWADVLVPAQVRRWAQVTAVGTVAAISIVGWSLAAAASESAAPHPVAVASVGRPDHTVLGSWRVTATATDPDPSTAHVLVTFTPGGGLVETRLLAKPPSPGIVDFATMETPGHDGWAKTGPRTYDVEYIYLIQAVDSADLLATETVRWRATVSPDFQTISGPASSEVHLADGTLVVSWTFTGSGTRIAP